MSYERKLAIARRAYAALVELYPTEYKQRMAGSMLQTFDDLCREHKSKGFRFAPRVFGDTLISILKENLMATQTTKKLALYSLVLLVPFTLVFTAAWIWQVFSWIGLATAPDLTALIPNVDVAYWLIFLAPALALTLNAGALAVGAVRVGPRAALTAQFAKSNALSLGVAVLAAGVTVFIFGHDAIPCFVRGILNGGWGNIGPLFQACMRS